ncbi:MAG: arginase family protein [Chitinophagaceae bacterium]|nr:arginase family protein [Chitinophagaceae bacterium]
MKHFKYYSKEDILSHTQVRKFETKLGEVVACKKINFSLEDTLKETPSKYILFGIPEDAGIKGNQGIGGADSVWFPFLSSFLNIQSNDFLSGENILLLGHFDFSDIKSLIESNATTPDEKLEAYRHAIITIDEEVEYMVKMITQHGKIPLIIGGGHNNAYPAIKGAAKGLYKKELIQLAQINCINLDAQADYRPIEGRHSGNAFRYADEDGYLNKYCVIGLHENYLQQNVWLDMVNNPFIDCITYEDIFIHEKRNFIQAIAHATGFTEDSYAGIELDLDCIKGTLCSASTPSGLTVLHARQYMNFVATDAKVAYLHICEGATKTDDDREDMSTGKLISYLVSDFVKAHNAK